MVVKLSEQCNYKYKSCTRNSYQKDEFGFFGNYVNKDLGVCDVVVTQNISNKYYLMLKIVINGFEYHRRFICSDLPSYRLAGLQAKKFLEELKKELKL